MFDYSTQELSQINNTLEPLLARAEERKAEAEQLAMDATRLLSIRFEQIKTVANQPFYKRLCVRFLGSEVKELRATQDDLLQMQKIGWKYIEILNERDLMLAHSMITVKNNLLTLAVKEEETRKLMTNMANRIADRFETLEQRVGELETQQNIHSWLLTVDTYDYDSKYKPHLRLLKLIQDFSQLKNGNWTLTEIKYLQKALKEVDLPWKASLTLADFIDGTIDEIELHGFERYLGLIELTTNTGNIEPKFILENVSVPSFKALHRIAESYGTSSEAIDILADELGIPRAAALKKVLRGFIEREGIDTTVAIEWRDLAVELLGCRGLVIALNQQNLLFADNFISELNTTTKPVENNTVFIDENDLLQIDLLQIDYLIGNDVESFEEKIASILKKYISQFSAFQQESEKGNVLASYIVFLILWNDNEDDTEDLAKEYLEKAVNQGNAFAQCFMGNNLYSIEDYSGAFSCYSKSAQQGNAFAQFMVGELYCQGKGCSKDEEKAFEYCLKSAEQGNAQAQAIVGDCYFHGWVCLKNEEKAFEYYLKSAEQGNASAQAKVSDCYLYGCGCLRNEEKAFEYCLKSAEQENEFGQCNLGLCYLFGYGVTVNYEKAFEYYLKSAQQGYLVARNELIQQICRKYKELYIADFYIGDNIPKKKLKNARASFINQNENVIALFDSTLFGSCEEGFAICEKGIYCKSAFLSKSKELFLWSDFIKKNIYIHDNFVMLGNIPIFMSSGNHAKILNLFKEIQDIMKQCIEL